MVKPSPEEIAEILAYRKQRGLSYAELSRQTGLSASTLARWDHRQDRESRFVEVDVSIDEGDDSAGAPGVVTIVSGDLSVLVHDGFDEGTLARVLKVIARRC